MTTMLFKQPQWGWDLLQQPQMLAQALLALALPVVLALLLVRGLIQMLRLAYPDAPWVRTLHRVLTWGIWVVLLMWASGFLPLVIDELDRISWRIGGTRLSLWALIEAILNTGLVLLLTIWISAAVERKLLAGVSPVLNAEQLSLRKMLVNFSRAALLTMGVLLALSAAGIPLTALSVFGGALGVGVGLGLQKLAANYVSGFVILAERSLRIGDMVKLDNFEGVVVDIKTRYTILRSLSGRESVVPNEVLVTQRIENATLSDRRMLVTTVLRVVPGTDLMQLCPALKAATAQVPRVLADPAPEVQFSQFAQSGLELTVLFWIADPENGQGNVRSDVNFALHRVLSDMGVTLATVEAHLLTPP